LPEKTGEESEKKLGISRVDTPRGFEILGRYSSSLGDSRLCVWKRMSSREFGPEPLPVEVLSSMLWAAFGINHPDGRRTAPSAGNRQEINIYVATPSGTTYMMPRPIYRIPF